jgi:trimeric autotransporter adhesin
MDNTVEALAVFGGTVYAGGDFTFAGGAPAGGVASWNGSGWSAVLTSPGTMGVSDIVYATAVSGSDVYAGGEFKTAGGATVNHIAKWNGSSWSALGTGMNDTVHALLVSVCGGRVHHGGRSVCQRGCQMERHRVVRRGLGSER